MKNKKKTIIIIISSILLIALITACVVFFVKQYEKTTFYDDTTVNGMNVSGLTPDQALELLTEDYDTIQVSLLKNEKPVLEGGLGAFGYTIDLDTLLKDIDALQNGQKGNLFIFLQSLLKGNSFDVDIPFLYDQTVLQAYIDQVFPEDEMTQTADAYMNFNEETKLYEIIPEVYGTSFDTSKLLAAMEEQLASFTANGMPKNNLSMEFPEELFTLPSVKSDDKDLTTLCNIYNQYCLASITYQFGSQTQVLDWSTIQNWLIIDGDKVSLDSEAIKTYVSEMANTYNTLYRSRKFKTSVGKTITIPGNLNEYGYKLDQEAEIQKLTADITNNTAVEREPVYVKTSKWGNPYYYAREGTDDLAGTYIEVNLTKQHLWFYKNGSLVVESDLVSGCVADKAETQTGCFPIAYKESPSVLTGGNAENGYSEEVQFWMAFFEGQGLHDASWRSNFGGDIYLENGSHGCVNLPYGAAEKIYQHSKAGMAIILYK